LKPLDRGTGNLGDIIIAVNGKRTDTLSSFVAELDRAGIGSTVDLTVVRDDKPRHVSVQVVELEP
jgi:S1-C subfamily serine protease